MKLNKVNELGRSMVEMLGVLAIVGVLSVMGIAGYTVAMSNHHANEVLNQVNRVAMLISAERQLHGGVGSPTSDDNPYAVSLDTNNTNKIVLTASNVPAGALEKLKNMNLSVPKINVSGTTVTFTFANDLSEISVSDTDNGGQVETPDCSQYAGTDWNYTGGFVGKAKDTITDCNCPDGNIWKDGVCKSYACENELSDPDACADHISCTDLEHGAWIDGVCYGAGDPYCPNTKFGKTVCNKATGCGWVYGGCHSCDTDYPEACMTKFECDTFGVWVSDACYGHDGSYCPLTKYGESICNAAEYCGWVNDTCVPCDSDHLGACTTREECAYGEGIWIVDTCYPMKENGCPDTADKEICESEESGCLLDGNDCVPPSF